jgi:prevent-host-death family protein
MTTRVPSRELRNDTAGVLRRAEAGEDVVITVNGRDVARLVPVETRPTWVDTRAFLASLPEPDANFARDIADVVGDETTDDLPWR